jgi:hypothetical protein
MAYTLFNSQVSHWDKAMSTLFSVPSYEDIGITKRLYKLCEIIDYNYNNIWNHKMNMSFLHYHAFESLEEFKSVYVRAKLYNAIRFNPSQTLRQYIALHQMRIKQCLGKDIRLRTINNFNIIEFLMHLSIEELFCIQW